MLIESLQYTIYRLEQVAPTRSMDVESAQNSVLFRPAKKRKFQRSTRPTEDGDIHAEFPPPDLPSRDENDRPSDELALTQILRQRKMNKNRRQGIEFSTIRPSTTTEPTMSNSLATVQPEVHQLKAISDRFVGHTGQVVDVDKHMMAYIDSEMTKRRVGQNLSSRPTNNDNTQPSESDSDSHDARQSGKRPAQRDPASLGKIQEIDLGADASLRNVERTENAIRRAWNGETLPDPDEKPPKPRRLRLGRDGKSMKPRPRKRRNSEDIKRDQLVEEVLRESKLEIYDDPADAPPGDSNNDDLNTDEKIAERFRQDFIDAMESRHRHRTSGQPKMPVGKPGEGGQKGPKLGGSRSARAAMRERELAEQKGKK